MTTTISLAGTSITPLLTLGYKSTRQSGNILHKVMNSASRDVTFGSAGLRTGTLSVLCEDHDQATAIEELHTRNGVLALTDTDLPGIAMSYVPTGAITSELDDETRTLWIVTIDFEEVSA